jgi:hypothetical protein
MEPSTAPGDSYLMGEQSLSYLLYLYLWPFWMFENVNSGSMFERAAAYRRNRAKRIHLLDYIVKWIAIFMLFLALVFAFESLGNVYSVWKFSSTLLTSGACILVVWAYVMIFMMAVMYAFFTWWED